MIIQRLKEETIRFPVTTVHQQDSGYELRVGDRYACDDLLLEDVTAIADALGGGVTAQTKDEAVSLLRVWMLRQVEREEARQMPVPRGMDAKVDWQEAGF